MFSMRYSKFRHVYGSPSRKENCYEGVRITSSAHDSLCCAVNPKFIAVILEVAGGGAFQVLPLKWTGRIDYNFGRVSGHNGPVTDLKWNPFNDNVIASASDDATVKLWYIPDGGLKTAVTTWLCELVGHTRKVAYLEWHPTAENILATAGFDHRIFIWDVAKCACLVAIDCHEDTIYSMSFNTNGSLLATTCKDKILRVINSRTGEVVQEGWSHDGSKASKVVYLGDKKKLFTTGFSRSSNRQYALWDESDLSRPIVLTEIDSSSGVLFPFYDVDTSMVYVGGKGDGNIRYYEITDSRPFVHYLNEFRSTAPQRGLAAVPKRGLKVSQCEIFRLYKVHNTQPLIEPISFVVPRKSEVFQSDLYPATAGPTPALTSDEWICGIDRDPVVICLKAGFVPSSVCTSKPVQMKKGVDGSELITADRNNERKFRFLSEITKPDYREVSQRDDYERIKKEEDIRNNMNEILSQRHSHSVTSGSTDAILSPMESPVMRDNRKSQQKSKLSDSVPLARISLSSGDEMLMEDEENRPPQSSSSAPPGTYPSSPYARNPAATSKTTGKPPKSPATTSTGSSVGAAETRSRHSGLLGTDDSTEGMIIEGMEEDFDGRAVLAVTPRTNGILGVQSQPVSPRNFGSNIDKDHGHRPVSLTNSAASLSHTGHPRTLVHPSASVSNVPSSSDSSRQRPTHLLSSSHSQVTQLPRLKPQAVRVNSSTSDDISDLDAENREKTKITRPGRIIPGPLLPREQTAHIKPFLISNNSRPPPKVVHSDPLILSPAESPSKKEAEIQKLYTQQCKQMRNLMDEVDAKDSRIGQLTKDIQLLGNQVDRLERSLVEKREETDSLRYEIHWKDTRIGELQTQLYKLLEGNEGQKSHQPASNTTTNGGGVNRQTSEEDPEDGMY